MVAISGIGERAFLVDDAQAGFVRTNGDGANGGGVQAVRGQLRVELHGAFDGGLCVKLGGVTDFEQHVLHHIRTVGALEFELLPFE